jgi:hypothetical protein
MEGQEDFPGERKGPYPRIVTFGRSGHTLRHGHFSSYPAIALPVPGFGSVHHDMFRVLEPTATDRLYELKKKFPITPESEASEESGLMKSGQGSSKAVPIDPVTEGMDSSAVMSKGQKRQTTEDKNTEKKKMKYSREHPIKITKVVLEEKKKNMKNSHKFNVTPNI